MNAYGPSLLLLGWLCLGTAHAQAPDTEHWARVVQVRGPVSLETPNGPRPLARGDLLRAGDVLVSGTDGFTELRAWDGSELNLMQDGRLILTASTAPGAGGPPQGSTRYRLEAGGLRLVTGSAVTTVDTPLARLQPKGAIECLQEHELNCAVSHGWLELHNAEGSLRLGEGGNFDFALVANARSAPLGLLSIPPPLDPAAAALLNGPAPVQQPAGGAVTSHPADAPAFPEPEPIVVQPRRR